MKTVYVEKKGKTPDGKSVKIVSNIYGNWYGYVGGRRVELFMNDQETEAREWFARMTGNERVSDFRDRIRRTVRNLPENAILGAARPAPELVRGEGNSVRLVGELAKTHVRAGETLAEKFGVEVRTVAGVKKLFYHGRALAFENPDGLMFVCDGTMPKRVARALGHFLIHNARETK